MQTNQIEIETDKKFDINKQFNKLGNNLFDLITFS